MAACPTHRSWFTARNPAAERGTTGRTWSWLEKPELGPALMLLLGARYSWPSLSKRRQPRLVSESLWALGRGGPVTQWRPRLVVRQSLHAREHA